MYPLYQNQKPYFWENENGQRLLVWNGEHYNLGNALGIVLNKNVNFMTENYFGKKNGDVAVIKQSATVQYDEAMIEAMEKHAIQDGKKGASSADADEETGSDPMLKQAVEVVIDAGQASTSLLQRRCKLGYARAARIMDEMEQKGIIGPYEGAKPRAVLISRQQWLEMQMNQPEE